MVLFLEIKGCVVIAFISSYYVRVARAPMGSSKAGCEGARALKRALIFKSARVVTRTDRTLLRN